MENMMEWARNKGAVCNVVTCTDHPRKLFAATDILPGDVVFGIPRELLLHGSLALCDREYGAAFRTLLVELGPTVLDQRSLLVLLLVLERCRGEHSAFAPYIDMLPEQYDDPFWWSAADLQFLQGTRLHRAVQHYNSGLQQMHKWLLRLEELHQQQQQQQQQQQAHGVTSVHRQQQQQTAQQQMAGNSDQQRQQQHQCTTADTFSTGGTLKNACGGWGLTHDAVKWARSAVWSRAFTIRGFNMQHCSNIASRAAAEDMDDSATAMASSNSIAAAKQTTDDLQLNNSGDCSGDSCTVVALVPVLDMCDHHPDQRVSWRVTAAPPAVIKPSVITQPQCSNHFDAPVVQQQHFGNKQNLWQPEQQQQQRPVRALQQKKQQQQHEGVQDVPGVQQFFEFTTLKAVPKGTELFNNYGTTKPNEELLLGYGFVLEPNSHDSFLVSIAHSATAPADIDSDEGCDVTAQWQQRAMLIKQAGLKLEVPVSIEQPLPGQLLDIMLLALVPVWQLPQLKHAAGLLQNQQALFQRDQQGVYKASGQHMQQQQQQQTELQLSSQSPQDLIAATRNSTDNKRNGAQMQHQQQQHSALAGLFSSAPAGLKLSVLQHLKQQLIAKLDAMLPASQLERILALSQQQQQNTDQQEPTAEQHQQQHSSAIVSHPVHARLAAVYVLSQQNVLEAALEAVHVTAAQVLADLVIAQPWPHPAAAAGAPAAAANFDGADAGADTVLTGLHTSNLHSTSNHQCRGCLTAFGNLHPGVVQCSQCGVLRTCKPIDTGSSVLRVPLGNCLLGMNEQQLIVQLMLAVAQHNDACEQDQATRQALAHEGGAAYFAAQWQHQQQQGTICSRFLPWWLQQQNIGLVDVLSETPLGRQFSEATEELQADFEAFCSQVVAAATEAAMGSSTCTAQVPELRADGPCQLVPAAATLRHQQQQQQLLAKWLQHNGIHAGWKLYCRAALLVQQSVVHLQLPGQQCMTALVPGTEQIPKAVRSVVFKMQVSELSAAASGARLHDNHNHNQQQQQRQEEGALHVSDISTHVVTIRSTCQLPAGLQLGSECLATEQHAQQLVLDHGPAALAAISSSAAAAAAAGDSHPAAIPTGAAVAAHQLTPPLKPVYEMMIHPAGDDPLRVVKLQLLAATGLGVTHHLSLLCALSLWQQLQPPPVQQHEHVLQGQQSVVQELPGGQLQMQGTVVILGLDPPQQQQQQQQKRPQQQQLERYANRLVKQHLLSIVSAMAVCMCDDNRLLNGQLVQQVVRQALLQQHPGAAGQSTSSVSATAAMFMEPTGQAATIAAAAPAVSIDQSNSQQALEQLQGQLLKQYGKVCLRQLLQELQADLEAVQQAQQQLPAVDPSRVWTPQQQQQVQGQQASGQVGIHAHDNITSALAATEVCSLCQHLNSSCCTSSDGGMAWQAAVHTVACYLSGLHDLLAAWVQHGQAWGPELQKQWKKLSVGQKGTNPSSAERQPNKRHKKAKRQKQ